MSKTCGAVATSDSGPFQPRFESPRAPCLSAVVTAQLNDRLVVADARGTRCQLIFRE